MTGQIEDTCHYEGGDYAIAGIEGEGLFDPAEYGMLPVPVSSACWRGFVCRYEVAEGRLLLDELSLREHEGRYPPLGGVKPLEDHYGAFVYRGLRLPVAFTGRLLLASGFIQKYYVHMGFQSPTSYEKVLELSFEAGKLLDAADRSAEMAELRQAYQASEESGYTNFVEWIARRFERTIPPEEGEAQDQGTG